MVCVNFEADWAFYEGATMIYFVHGEISEFDIAP